MTRKNTVWHKTKSYENSTQTALELHENFKHEKWYKFLCVNAYTGIMTIYCRKGLTAEVMITQYKNFVVDFVK
jgi:hypothetical protein